MGNTQGVPAAHIRIYQNLIQIRDPGKRVEMINTLLIGAEYVQTARKMGVYSHLLSYVAKVQAGERPGYLPGEVAVPLPVVQQQQQRAPIKYGGGGGSNQLVLAAQPALQAKTSTQRLVKPRSKEKALTYFQSCLEVLGLEEEVALTEESLKAAYKAAALRAHPDKKGGSEDQFEAVTRAYAYLTEILRRIHGGRTKEGKVEAPNTLLEGRREDAKAWQHVEPVRLNPKKLDMDAFNKMFEATRPPDPDDDGYGDWLTNKQEESGVGGGGKFSGKFNRDVFNKMFEEQSRSRNSDPQNQLVMLQPQALTLAPNTGVELGREKASSYTAAANASLKYTDLKQAYTVENTLSPQVSGVRVEQRDIKSYKAAREKAPDPFNHEELAAIAASERHAAEKERQRQLRVAQDDAFSNEYFNRMKRLVLTDQSSK
jgi:curved DNA-binding protein CbpA